MVDDSAEALEVTWKRAVKVWWALVWRATVISVVVGAILGGLGGVGVALTGKGHGGTVGAILGWLGSIPVSVYVVRQVLRKQFREFAIRLVLRSTA